MTERLDLTERLSLVAPLGVRFWDGVTGRFISDGLSVTVYPSDNPAQRRSGFVNKSGVYVLRDLPGLRVVENRAGDADFWNNLPARRHFIIEVIDQERRFLPFRFTETLPMKGLLRWDSGPLHSPLTSPLAPDVAGVPLFSTPGRSVPGGMAVLYANLWDTATKEPAAWALVEARLAGQPPAYGLADADGKLSLMMAYPPPLEFEPESSSETGRALTQQRWVVALQAWYTSRRPSKALPDLRDLLMNQSPAILWVDDQSLPLTRMTLEFGRPLVARSENLTSSWPQSVLLITSESSPL